MRRMLLILLSIALVPLSGCWDLMIIEDLSIALAIAIDCHPEDPEKFIFTVTNPTFSEEADQSTRKIAVEGYSIFNAISNMQKQRGNPLVLGQVATIIFSEEAARSGLLHEVMHQVNQQRDINPNVSIIIVQEALAQDVIYLEPPEETRVAVHLRQLMNQAFNTGIIPRVTASRYWSGHATVGLDPVIPTIQLTGKGEEKTAVKISGVAALDSQGKMKGVYSDDEVILGMLLQGQNRRSSMTTQLDLEGELRDISLMFKNSRFKVRTAIENDSAKFALSLFVDVDVINIDWWMDALDTGAIKEVETALAQDIQGNLLTMLRKSQSYGADNFGLGQFVRIQQLDWFKERDWAEAYRESEITLEVKTNIRRLGTVTNPGQHN